MLAFVFACLVLRYAQTPIQAAAHATPPPPQAGSADDSPGAKVYADKCSICHGEHREGDLPAFPPLAGIAHRMNGEQIAAIVQKGRGRMPAEADLQGEELAGLIRFLTTADAPSAQPPAAQSATANPLVPAGKILFQQNCAFCHGRDAMGGESGPDLTQSKIVLSDVDGNKIGEVVREGRPEKKMPSFNFSPQEVGSLAAYVHAEVSAAAKHKGGRRGVTVADLQTGNVEAGKQYFNGAGTCAKCHSPAGDLAGVASRFRGLELEQRMLYPRGAVNKITVTLPSGAKVTGAQAYLDEFTVALRDASGAYRSWPVSRVKVAVDAPVEAHARLFGKYTDADIHNLMAYLQTLR